YRTDVTLPASWTGSTRGAKLDLGNFSGSVQVYVNAARATADIDPQAPIDITQLLRPGTNTIKVVLATTLMNKAAVSPTTPVTRAGWAASIAHGTQAYGLQSEVRLLPYARRTVALTSSHGASFGWPFRGSPLLPPVALVALVGTAVLIGQRRLVPRSGPGKRPVIAGASLP
ncbi:MAG: hypothetical protein ABR549_01915, partial [Mycobacteriales bacterium]